MIFRAITSGTNPLKMAAAAIGTIEPVIVDVAYQEMIMVADGNHPDFNQEYIDSLEDPEEQKEVIRARDFPSSREKNIVRPVRYLSEFSTSVILQYIDASSRQKDGEAVQPTIKKICQDPRNSNVRIELFKAFLGLSDFDAPPEMLSLDLHAASGESPNVIFVDVQCGTKVQINQFKKDLESDPQIGSRVIVVALCGATQSDPNGDNEAYTNRKAEDKIKSKLREAKGQKKKLIILSMGMGARSFSISEITHELHLRESGDINFIAQIGSRKDTPGLKYDGQTIKTTSHEFFFAFDYEYTSSIFHQCAYVEEQALYHSLRQDHPDISMDEVKRLYYTTMPVNKLTDSGTWKRMSSGELDLEITSYDNTEKIIRANLVSVFPGWEDFSEELIQMYEKVKNELGRRELKTNKIRSAISGLKGRTLKRNIKPPTEKEEKKQRCREEEVKNMMDEVFGALIRSLYHVAFHVEALTGQLPTSYQEALSVIITSLETEEWERRYGIKLETVLSVARRADPMDHSFSALMRKSVELRELKY